MKKPGLLPLLLSLMLASGWAAAAQWARVAGGSAHTFYFDKASITKVEKTSRKVWSMQTFRKEQTAPEGHAYRSVKALHLYSCNEHTATLLAQVFYPEPLGKGEPVENYKYEKYGPEDIVPDSPQDRVLSVACKLR
ncbi:MAG: hypothetical protein JO370_06735 [Paucibacter sp.]|nr:hypothetical protein [Roseateles sp.]